MRSWLLLYSFVTALLGAGPARAQYIYMDTNGDGICTYQDYLVSTSTSVDIYLDTDHEANGTVVTCATNPSQPMDIFSYDLLLESSSDRFGSLTVNGWTNAMTGFTVINPLTIAGRDIGVGYGAPVGTVLPPGLYKLGTLSVAVQGSIVGLFFLANPVSGIPSPVTGFGSSCDASDYGNTVSLGVDFVDNCGLYVATDDVKATTWGKIKMTYR